MKRNLVVAVVVCVLLAALLLLIFFAIPSDQTKRVSFSDPRSSIKTSGEPIRTSPATPPVAGTAHGVDPGKAEAGIGIKIIVKDYRGEIAKDPLIEFASERGGSAARMGKITRVDDRTYRVVIERPGTLLVKAFLSKTSNAGAQQRIEVAPDDAFREVELTLPKTSVLQGVIRGKGGLPVKDAAVQVWLAQPEKSRLFPEAETFDSGHLEMTTGEDGIYRFERLISGYEEKRKGFQKVETGMVYKIKVTHRDYYEKIDQCVIGGEEATVRNILLIPKGLKVLKGVVYGKGGMVIVGAEVCYTLDISGGAIHSGYTVPSDTKTNDLGEFDLDIKGGSITEKMTLVIKAKGHRLYKTPMASIQPSDERVPFRLEPGKVIAGRICDGENNPLKHVKVIIIPTDAENKLSTIELNDLCLSTFSDENGRYEVASLEDVPYDVVADVWMLDNDKVDAEAFVKNMEIKWEEHHIMIENIRPDNLGVDFVFKKVK